VYDTVRHLHIIVNISYRVETSRSRGAHVAPGAAGGDTRVSLTVAEKTRERVDRVATGRPRARRWWLGGSGTSRNDRGARGVRRNFEKAAAKS